MSYYYQCKRQHIVLSYFKTLSVGPVWDLTLDLLHRSSALYNVSERSAVISRCCFEKDGYKI